MQDIAPSWVWSLLITYGDCHGHVGTGNSSLASQRYAGTSFSPLLKLAMPEYTGLAHCSIQAASETWPRTCLPNLTRCFLPCRWDLWVCSAAGTVGPSQPRPQHHGTSHSRATGTHPPRLDTHLAVQTLAPFSSNRYAPKPPNPHLYCPGPPRGWITAAHIALTKISAAAASGQRQAQGAASFEGARVLASGRQKLLPSGPFSLT